MTDLPSFRGYCLRAGESFGVKPALEKGQEKTKGGIRIANWQTGLCEYQGNMET
jgi:hypothetical protein